MRLGRLPVKVEIWRDRYIFRDTEASIERLSRRIGECSNSTRYGLVTHSFGDWVARQAISRTPNHCVEALASIAPVMKSGIIPQAIHWLSGDLIPEIAIIADPELASKSLDCQTNLHQAGLQDIARLRRLIVWAAIDLGVRRIDVSHLTNVKVQHVAATHLSVVMQPDVHRVIEDFLGFNDDEHPSETRVGV